MRPRTPTFIWIPFVFSIGGISWALLLASLAALSALLLAPALEDARQAEVQRNDVQATVALLDKKIALQQEFIEVAGKDPLVLERLASRQLRKTRADQQVLVLDPASLHKDQSVKSLLAESLTPVTPQPVPELPWIFRLVLTPAIRTPLAIAACIGLALGFLLGVRYARPPVPLER